MCPPVPQKGLQTFEQGSNLLHLCKSQAPTIINCIKENVNKRWRVELTIHIIATVWCLNATENRYEVCHCTGLKWRRQKETCREPGSWLHRMMLMCSMSNSDRLQLMLGVRFLIFIFHLFSGYIFLYMNAWFLFFTSWSAEVQIFRIMIKGQIYPEISNSLQLAWWVAWEIAGNRCNNV